MSDSQDLQLWCVDVAAAGPALHVVEQSTPRLSEADRQRASAFSDSVVRAEWLAAHIALRLVIEHAAGPSWRGIALAHAARGKPYLDGAPLTFSLSHAQGLALIAVAAGGCVGVDVERTRSVRIDGTRRARILDAGAAISSTPLPAADADAFLQAWVRLEALGKAEGCGIGRLLTRLGILGAGAGVAVEAADTRQRAAGVLGEAEAKHVHDLQLGKGIFAAVAASGVPASLAVRWLPSTPEGLERLLN